MKLRLLFKYFPAPGYLHPSHIGISFSEDSIKAVFFDARIGPQSLKASLVPIEKGAISGGKIVNMDEVVKKLIAIKEGFDSPFVFFAIPDEITYIFSAEIPIATEGDISEAVAFVMEENVPLPLSDVVFDFHPIKVTADREAFTVVAAAERREVEKFAEAFSKAGFESVGCIHESEAVAKSVVPKKYGPSVAVVHARGNKIGIYLAKKGVVHFSTTRSVSGDYREEFLDEYQKFVEYCDKYDEEGGILKSVFVCGEFEYAKKATEILFDSKLCQNVKLANVWTNVFDIETSLPDIPYEKSLSFSGAVGATLSDVF
jgi:Tfp pilus assembly PilM family ATPase